MIDRYTRPEMARIWSLDQHYQCWLEVELLACEAWSKLGVIPEADIKKLRANAKFDAAGIAELEKETRHDVVAFTRNVSSYLGDEKKWVHYGLTSTDICDTANGYQIRLANECLRADLNQLLEVLKRKALQYKDTVCMGRTHGVHAEPTTFGLKMARYYAALKRDIERFEHAASGVEAGKISGAVGTFANVPPFVEAYVCEQLGIRAQDVSTQVLPRDLHAEYLASIALIASNLEMMATEIRGLQKTECREVEEYFAGGQKGSSAMPHKRNPIGCENLCGLSRVIRGYMVTAYENVALWHERDISHSSTERIIIADASTLLDYMLHRFTDIIDKLIIFPERMLRNMQASYGLIYSQRVLLKLVDKGLSREAAYDIVQPLTALAWEEGREFKTFVETSPAILARLTSEEIDEAFDYHYHLTYVDSIYQRLGLIQ